MKILFIGGTGTISTAISNLVVEMGMELYLLNRGSHTELMPKGANLITANIYNEAEVMEKIKDMTFDVVAEFIAFDTTAVERDYRIFKNKTKQYIFISSASAYQKPLSSPVITESTPLSNPYWEYSRNKIACEELLIKKYRETGFPITIIRPSHTYGDRSVPVAVHGKNGSYSVINRMLKGKKVIVHGDGNTLWTLTHNTDFAKAFVGIMANPHAIGESYHITSDESLTWNQIYEIIGSTLGVKPDIVHIPSDLLARHFEDLEGSLLGDKAHSVMFDNSKIKRAVPDYVATTRFDQGIRKTIDFIMSHNELQQEDNEFDTWCDDMIETYEEACNKMYKYE